MAILQVEARAHGVWGGEEGLEEERERKTEAREKKREKKYVKEIQSELYIHLRTIFTTAMLANECRFEIAIVFTIVIIHRWAYFAPLLKDCALY